MSVKINIWGVQFWKLLHAITVLYPINPSSNDKAKIINFFNAYIHLLPCQECKEHYIKNLGLLGLDNHTKSKNLIILFGIKLHNIVNRSLKKQIGFYENENGVNKAISIYNVVNIRHLLGYVMMYSLQDYNVLDSQISNALNSLFESTVHFAQYRNITLNQELSRIYSRTNFKLKVHVINSSQFLQR